MIQQEINIGGHGTQPGLHSRLLNKLRAMFKPKRREPLAGDAGAVLAWRLRSYINLRPPQKDANIPAIIYANKVSIEARMQSPGSHGRSVVMPNSFSQALSESHTTELLHNTAGHKLVQSALDHLHASIRYAKAGDPESAHLHASIMNSAVKEAAHYASANEYRDLVQILEKELNRLS